MTAGAVCGLMVGTGIVGRGGVLVGFGFCVGVGFCVSVGLGVGVGVFGAVVDGASVVRVGSRVVGPVLSGRCVWVGAAFLLM